MRAVFAPVQGDFQERAPVDLLRLCEEKRFTGLIEIEGAQIRGSVLMRAGEVATLQLQGAPGDALEAFLTLQEGRYTLRQHVATLDGGLSSESVVRGSLAEHGPTDVLRFCEATGLSGQVRMSSGGRRLEVHYDAGVLTTIAVDGQSDADLTQAFAWRAGEFAISARAVFDPPRRLDESGLHFLSVVEVALAKVVETAEKVRESEPVQRPIPLVTRRRRGAPPPPPTERDRTVQIYFLQDVVPDAPPPASESTTRHARQGELTAELVGTLPELPPAAGAQTAPTIPSRRPVVDAASTPTERRPAVRDADATPLWVWIGVGAAVGAVVVALLAKVLL